MALLQEIKVPLLSVNDTYLTVAEISFPNGQLVKTGEIVLIFETSKTTYEVPAETGGYIQYLAEQERDYPVNYTVAKIFSELQEAQAIPAGNDPRPNNPLPARSAGFVPGTGSSPAVRIAADEHFLPGVTAWKGETLFSREAVLLLESAGLNRNSFTGRDFVTKNDVAEAMGLKQPEQPRKPIAGTGKMAPVADPARVLIEKLSSNKKREIEYLGEVQAPGLTSTINVTVETENIFDHINRSLKYFKNSLLPVILYETGRLLGKYPVLNGYFTGDGIAVYKQVNIGFAIDLEKGLKVLKIADTGAKTLNHIEDEILMLSNRYLDETLRMEDLTDITFTITDLSGEGVAFFRPLVNMMNSAILGVSAIDEKLRRCTLSLTFDHRVTEGKLAALFLQELKARLESYRSAVSNLSSIHCFKCLKTLSEDLSDTGFVRGVSPQGKEGYICQSCLKGF